MDLKGIQFLTLCLAACISFGLTSAPKKIINGVRASQIQFPHQVSLQKANQHFCGGSIITAIHILTAAHCIYSTQSGLERAEALRVITGVIDHEDRRKDNVFQVSGIFYNTAYNPTTFHNDIAVLRVDRQIPFNLYQRPISLPAVDTPSGAVVEASGWGMADRPGWAKGVEKYLQKLAMVVVNSDACRPFYPTSIYDGSICVMSAQNTGACKGDSGGPLTYQNTIIGIASFVFVLPNGLMCATGRPDVYTRVYPFVPWIAEVIRLTS